MISLNDNRGALCNLKLTIDALDQLDLLIKYYSKDKGGPAYCTFGYVDGPGDVKVQIARSVIVPALVSQRNNLVTYLATLGIDASSTQADTE